MSISASPILDGKGLCTGHAMTLRDISAARRAERELAELNATLEQRVAERTSALDTARRDLRTILDALPSQIGSWDRNLVNRLGNRAYADWFGTDTSRMHGMHFRDVVGEDIYRHNRPYLEAALAGEAQYFVGLASPNPNGGNARHAMVNIIPEIVNGEVHGLYTLVHDITELAESRARLARSERDNAALLHTIDAHAMVSVADRDGRIIEVNKKFCRSCGYSRHELLGKDHRLLRSGMHDAEFWCDMWAALAAGKTWRGEICNRAQDGKLYWIDAVISAFCNEQGEVEKYVAIGSDISAKKLLALEAQEARTLAEQSLRFLQEITDRLPLGIAYLDQSLIYRFVNAAACEQYGLPREQILGRHAADLPELPQLLARPHYLAATMLGAAQTYEYEQAQDGRSTRILEVRLVPDADAGGAIRGVFSLYADISDRKRAELELQRALNFLQVLLDAASEVSIVATATDGTITQFNRGAERLTGYAREEMIAQNSALLYHDREEMRARAAQLSAQAGRRVPNSLVLVDACVLNEAQEWNFCRKDGSRVPVSQVVTAIRGEGAELLGYLCVALDVSRQKEYERGLHEAAQRSEQANLAKSRFLANMSHEIRTPMNAVIGISYLLERTLLTPDQKDLLAKLHGAGTTLMNILNSVLDLSKIEAGELRIEQLAFSPAAVVHDVCSLMRPQAENKDLQFQLRLPAELPHALQGDAMRLAQILTNLLANAIKFTDQGMVQLAVRVIEQGQRETRLRFVVEDSGRGIEPAVQARLFAPFVQADASTTRRYGGTGLGLSIVKQLARLMGGDAGLRSTPGQGSKFWVEIEFTHAVEELPAPMPALQETGPVLAGTRILVADDSRTNLDVAQRILERHGASVSVASNGREASDLLAAELPACDLVLLDLQMPVLDGYAAAREIRTRHAAASLPILALTASTLASEREQALAAGMDDFITKPFAPHELLAAILRHLRRTGSPPVAAEPAATDIWPVIAGFDMEAAQARFSGDRKLFRSALARLFDEFCTASPLAPAADAAELKPLTARLHELKGSAGMLGAGTLYDLAAAAERSGRAGDLQNTNAALERIRAQIETLRGAAAAELNAREEQALATSTAGAGSADPDMRRVEAFAGMLRRNNLRAAEEFETLAPQLRTLLGAEDFLELSRHMEALRYDAALNVLEAEALR
ncbi:MAG: PAS domain S-box protein [Rhodocyclaceae bacterium]|nr:PAS domain S-box protein [Rhodocyclaceae bacterium]